MGTAVASVGPPHLGASPGGWGCHPNSALRWVRGLKTASFVRVQTVSRCRLGRQYIRGRVEVRTYIINARLGSFYTRHSAYHPAPLGQYQVRLGGGYGRTRRLGEYMDASFRK